MTLLTELQHPYTDQEIDAPAARRGRVWRAPRSPVAHDVQPRRRTAEFVAVLTASTIALGAVGLTRLDNGPSSPSTTTELGSLQAVATQIGATALWQRGITGQGTTVAVIDTGVAPVRELSGKVVAAVDLSGEASQAGSATIDTYGHGTHMAGIIAGRTPGADLAADESFSGIAPDASIVSVKVAGRDGSVSPAHMIAGLDWVVEHADELDIDVVTVAFDSGGRSAYGSDPLAAAVERAWDAGIVVVAAAGNAGPDSRRLSSPAHDPYVIAVAGIEATPDGFVVPEWASSGDGVRNPDVAAPGAHIRSLRAPGSTADLEHPEGYVDEQLFLGSGSSQAAAVVAGAAALLLSEDPSLTPDQVKQALITTSQPIVGARSERVGNGVVDVLAAVDAVTDAEPQTWARSSATVPEVEFATTSDGAVNGWWMGASWMGASWMGASWMGASWMGASWMGASWMGASWMGASWMGASWMGASWMGASWMGASWMGASWMGASWMGASWMGASWMGASWMGASWM